VVEGVENESAPVSTVDGPPGPATTLTGADRVLATLRLLGEFPEGVGLHELARRLHSPKSSVHRALGALRRAEFVEQDRDGRYRLSYGLIQLAFMHYDQLDDAVRVRPLLSTLAERYGETTHYAVLSGSEVVYQAKVQPLSSRYQMTSVIGGRNPAHCTGVGKVLLAYKLLSTEDVEDYVARNGPLARRTEHTITDAFRLDAELRHIREAGYGFDRQESETGINCLAVPLFLTSRREPDGAVSVTAVAQRLPLERLASSVDEIRAIIRSKLGGVLP
jgi:IclR family acetate operon transcriptional repressor